MMLMEKIEFDVAHASLPWKRGTPVAHRRLVPLLIIAHSPSVAKLNQDVYLSPKHD